MAVTEQLQEGVMELKRHWWLSPAIGHRTPHYFIQVIGSLPNIKMVHSSLFMVHGTGLHYDRVVIL